VADGIANLYQDLAGFTDMKITQSAPSFSGLTPILYEDDQIRLVYHGNADLARGLEALVSNVKNLHSRLELHLMLVGNARSIKKLKKIVAKENLGRRVYFIQPVAVHEIPKAINVYDLEIIFFPPLTKNLLYALPNKFFEAIQGAIGVVIGNSPSMRTIVDAEQIGLVVDGWKPSDLTTALNALDRATVNQYKRNAADAASRLNSDVEGKLFLNEIANS
jgi:glycosyltransferase involved in cell wall biosynthesis